MINGLDSFKDSCQCANYTGVENIAYCIPYGNAQWEKLWTFYSDRILPFIDNCHSNDRLNPLAWLDCGTAIYESEVSDWVNTYTALSFHHMTQKESGADMTYCANALSPYSIENWAKIMNTVTYLFDNGHML